MAETLFFNALREAIDEEMAKDPTVMLMGEDVGHYGGSYKVTKDLAKKYGDGRLLDTPIAENSFMGMAIGAAMTGLRPISRSASAVVDSGSSMTAAVRCTRLTSSALRTTSRRCVRSHGFSR